MFFISVEFMHYIITSKSLKKVFVSIKGIYYQVEILGQTITWITPHKLGFDVSVYFISSMYCSKFD